MSKEILEALKKLDVKDDSLWTGDGLPKLDKLGVKASRKEVTEAAPHFNRENPAFEPIAPLLGSSVQPDEFDLADGSVMMIDEVVAKAQAESGLDEKEWNDLDDEEREQYVAAIVETLELTKPEETQNAVQEEKGQGNQEEVVLLEEKTKLEAALVEAQSAEAAAVKTVKAIQSELDTIELKLTREQNGQTNQENIMAFIKSQNEQRMERAMRNQRIIDTGFGNPGKAPIDQALNNTKRPSRVQPNVNQG